MNKVPIIFARLAALYKALRSRLKKHSGYSVPAFLVEYFERYAVIRDELRNQLPDLYSDLPVRKLPSVHEDEYLQKEIFREDVQLLVDDMEYIFEVKANSELRVKVAEEPNLDSRPSRVFISHGRSPDWREVQDYVEKDLSIQTLELAQVPSKGRTVLQKLNEESDKCSFAVVVMTGDDDAGTGAPRVRENVMHEIGFFQGKYGLSNVCLLHEEGTSNTEQYSRARLHSLSERSRQCYVWRPWPRATHGFS